MKKYIATIKEKLTNSPAYEQGELVKYINPENKTMIIICSGQRDKELFSGQVLFSEEPTVTQGILQNNWSKKAFDKIFEGELHLSNQ